MAVEYFYRGISLESEAAAQSAVTAFKTRLDNNPTDWVNVKGITANPDGSYVMNPTLLTDSEINNPDTDKTYCLNCTTSGEVSMPLTSTELTAKVLECRVRYAVHAVANKIIKYDIDSDGETSIEINTTEDMSSYMS